MTASVVVKVAYRKFPDDSVIALFPEEINPFNGCIMSYMHIGQHSDASPELLAGLKSASPAEYEALHKELQIIGYNPQVI